MQRDQAQLQHAVLAAQLVEALQAVQQRQRLVLQRQEQLDRLVHQLLAAQGMGEPAPPPAAPACAPPAAAPPD